MNDSMHFDQNYVRLIILTSDSVAGTFTFFRASPCSTAHLLGHLFDFIIDQTRLATGATSLTGNSFTSFFGRSPGTPANLGFFAFLMTLYIM